MMDRLALIRKARRAVRHEAAALCGANFLAQVRFAAEAIFAFAAFGRVKGNDMIAHFQRGHAGAYFHHNTRPLMAHNGREQAFRISAGDGEFIGVANARCLDLDQHLAEFRALQIHLDDFKGTAFFKGDSGAGFHGAFSVGMVLGRHH